MMEKRRKIQVLLKITLTQNSVRMGKTEGYIKPYIAVNDRLYKISPLRFTSETNMLTILVFLFKALNVCKDKDDMEVEVRYSLEYSGKLYLLNFEKKKRRIAEIVATANEICRLEDIEKLLKVLKEKDKRRKQHYS